MEYWEPTQKVLQGEPPLVRRPKLTEALLKKPPFRFLHDVISELCRQTGFARGLFTADELISTNIKEKESKVAYLWKIVDCVGITLNTNVPARPLKIVAGLEPEQTNVFLQMLAAATMVDRQHSERAVARVLAGEKQPPPSHSGLEWIQLLSEAMTARDASLASEQQLPQTPDSEIEATQTRDKESSSTKRLPDGSTIMGLTDMEPASHQVPKVFSSCRSGGISSSDQERVDEQSLNASLETSPTLPEFVPTPHAVPRAIYNLSSELSPAFTRRTTSKEITPKIVRQSRPAPAPGCGSNSEASIKTTAVTDTSQPSPRAPASVGLYARLVSAVPSCNETKETAAVEDSVAPTPRLCSTPRFRAPAVCTSQRPQSARPQSARKAPPVVRSALDKGGAKEAQATLLERPASARLICMNAPPSEPVRKPSFLLAAEVNEDEQENMPILLPPPSMQETTVLTSVEGAGKLVRDILEHTTDLSEQEDEHGGCSDGAEETGIILGQIRGTSMKKGDVQSRKEEIRKLREAVQVLCQTVNPLGKSIDHLQEDTEIMIKEYQFWIKERDTYAVKVEEEKRITEEMLQAESDFAK
ncbi:TRAF3-interacting protein 1 [Marchantia polymorpha subsp. ruderalis]|uniref:TRAF3-interacting protein 1 n=2 Tax=Marchantia polymorpha TaxID=3197 RepID=A0AAF6ARX1_MARPO|nr:hypothetical protein MARPO_0001s0288 [Marchantia polymorpha]BBM99191.1 hypothetical protein Mp_1g19490 [Marchantia polymorpha subsp. ruderalis]|eukprot:PTQ50269.1 hypothetical protein MARPO_0001s0288 [Marchantia polymorpha]